MSNYEAPESDDDDYDDPQTFGGRDGFIFVIDANEGMFEESESSPAKFRTCLECIEGMMMNTIVNSERNLIGVLVYNTKLNPPPKEQADEPELVTPNNMAVYIPMRVVSKETIMHIRNIQESDDLQDFVTEYGHSTTPAKFADVMWLSSRMLTRCDYKLQSSTIVLFTNNDTPHPRGTNEYQQAFIRANDLAQQSIDFELVPMVDSFTGDNFYKEFLCTVLDENPNEFVLPSSSSQIEFLKLRVYRRNFRKKCNRHLKMSIGDGIQIGLSLYNCTRRTTYPAAKKLFRETNELVVAKRKYMLGELNVDTNRYEFDEERRLLPSEIRKSVSFGNEEIKFTSEEVSSMRSLMPPGLRLLGFKPVSKFSVHHYYSPPYFIFHDETLIKGSAVLFRALWEKCLQKEKAIVCVLTSRRKTAPKYVALIPQTEKLAENRQTLRSNGFRLVFLPCENNIRNLDVFDRELGDNQPSNGTDVFEKVIKKLKFRYRPYHFENPKLKKMYAHLEAIAFETDSPADDDFEDSTNPDLEEQDAKVAPFISQLTDLFGEFDITPDKGAKAKRAAPANGGESGGGQQRAKVPKLSNDNVDAEDIKAAVQNGTIEKYSVAALKAYLTSTGVTGISKLTKPALIEKVKERTNL